MDPITGTLAVLAIGAKLIGGASQADAIRRQAAFNREIAKTNNQLLEIQRQDVLALGVREGGKVREAAKRMESDQVAAFAAQGLDVDSGSAALVRADTAYLSEIDALEVKNNARKAAFGIKTQQIENTINSWANTASAASQASQVAISAGMGAIGDIASTYKSYKTKTAVKE